MSTPQRSTGSTLLEPPGTICPEQFRDLWSRSAEYSSEIRLVMAVLVQAIGDIRAFRGAAVGSEAARLYRRARRWIGSDDRRWPYSFLNVSEILNLPPTRVRLRLLEQEVSCSRLGRHYGAALSRRNRPLKQSAKRLRALATAAVTADAEITATDSVRRLMLRAVEAATRAPSPSPRSGRKPRRASPLRA